MSLPAQFTAKWNLSSIVAKPQLHSGDPWVVGTLLLSPTTGTALEWHHQIPNTRRAARGVPPTKTSEVQFYPALAWVCWVGRSIAGRELGHSRVPQHHQDEAGPGQGTEPSWLSMLLPQGGNPPHYVDVSTVCPPSTVPREDEQTLDVLGRESQMCPVSIRSLSPQS